MEMESVEKFKVIYKGQTVAVLPAEFNGQTFYQIKMGAVRLFIAQMPTPGNKGMSWESFPSGFSDLATSIGPLIEKVNQSATPI